MEPCLPSQEPSPAPALDILMIPGPRSMQKNWKISQHTSTLQMTESIHQSVVCAIQHPHEGVFFIPAFCSCDNLLRAPCVALIFASKLYFSAGTCSLWLVFILQSSASSPLMLDWRSHCWSPCLVLAHNSPQCFMHIFQLTFRLDIFHICLVTVPKSLHHVGVLLLGLSVHL